ncbi:MAG: hypothetical protein RLZZ76_223 [Candidatus Parcubacteria bacterium]|jgi:uncharacterized membrane protein YfcA
MELLIIFAIGFVSSVFGSFTSGGFSVMGFALLGAYGLSPLLVLSTFKVGAFGSQIGSLYNFIKADKVHWDKVWLFFDTRYSRSIHSYNNSNIYRRGVVR